MVRFCLTGLSFLLLLFSGCSSEKVLNAVVMQTSPDARSSCWPKNRPNRPASFILAMSANTDGLKKANDDAQKWANAIQKHFKVPSSYVCILKNVTQGKFEYALKKLQKLARQGDKVFIYFSGHGTFLPDNNNEEKNCQDEAFVTYYKRDPFVESIRDDYFVELVNGIKTNHIITFLDTCFASSFDRGKATERACRVTDKFLDRGQAKQAYKLVFRGKRCPDRGKHLDQLKGILYAASKENQSAFEIRDKGGRFTYVFIEIMKKLPKDSSLDEIFERTAAKISKETKGTSCHQEPQRRPSKTHSKKQYHELFK